MPEASHESERPLAEAALRPALLGVVRPVPDVSQGGRLPRGCWRGGTLLDRLLLRPA
jgi:hypothetical protein